MAWRHIPMKERAEFSQKIMQWRMDQNVTQSQLAEMIGCDSTVIGSLECRRANGSQTVNINYVMALKRIGCDISDCVKISSRQRSARINREISHEVRASKVIDAVKKTISLAKDTIKELDEYYKKLNAVADDVMAEMGRIEKAKSELQKYLVDRS